ncbi:MAG: radical SAM family heme chaperone HemW [Defluviitaleaceae bacterium]|nr:radical SAM family heme chaperone HemW [Defluviitaleaceae bacterium]
MTFTHNDIDMPVGLYIHIPFCSSKCDYCDFLSFSDKQNQWEAYKNALLNELSFYSHVRPIDTIYIGGGTPTVWPSSFLSDLLQALPPTLPDVEITCEANPGTLNEDRIEALISGGVNRISLGLQAWQPHLLKAIGRQTSSEIFLENYNALRHSGIKNINIDIMFALPSQSLDNWEETLWKVIDLEPEHISAYALTPEENTPLWARYGENICDDETDRMMYHRCKAILKECGYQQYEISNFCKPGFESKHNLRYWMRQPYIGLGLGAHSFANDLRWNNTTDFCQYIKSQRHVKLNATPITQVDAMAEFMFLGLRMTQGISIDEFAKEFDKFPCEVYGSWIVQMEQDGLLQQENGRIFLTDIGMDLANRVMAGFLE